jgi:predicted dehydrogenase
MSGFASNAVLKRYAESEDTSRMVIKMKGNKLRVGFLGAGRWAGLAHIPGWQRDPRCEIVTICDVVEEYAREIAHKFEIPEFTSDWRSVVTRPDIDVIDVCTSPSETHFEPSWAALEAGKHVLCEKPVAHDFRDTLKAAELAKRKKLKTKLGFTFRYSPGVQYAKSLIDEGFVGTPFIFNGYEQNSQMITGQSPLPGRRSYSRPLTPQADLSAIQTGSLEGYGAPIIDIGRWWMGADYRRVTGLMKCFVPERIRGGQKIRVNVDDGDVWVTEFTNNTIGSIQSSMVTVGNYPGVEARIYGSKGAIICRLVEEFGVAETIRVATPDAVEFKELQIPQKFYPKGGHPRESWRSLFYANLIKDFIDEILEGGERNQGNFEDGARVQEFINAAERAFHERRWVDISLER